MTPLKWFAATIGVVIGVSHIGMIGMISRKDNALPDLNVPVGDYTTYEAEVFKDGYKISYKANDPKTMIIEKDIKEKGGFLGLATETTKVVEEYVMDSKTSQGGAVSNHRSWLAPYQDFVDNNPDVASKSEACIEAIGGAKGTGRLVGTSVGAAAAPALSSIPFVGWVAAGWVAMFGGEQGANIGGDMAENLNKNC